MPIESYATKPLAELQATPNFTIFYQVKNLLNTPLRYNDGSPARTQQIEYYGRTYEGGLRFNF